MGHLCTTQVRSMTVETDSLRKFISTHLDNDLLAGSTPCPSLFYAYPSVYYLFVCKLLSIDMRTASPSETSGVKDSLRKRSWLDSKSSSDPLPKPS